MGRRLGPYAPLSAMYASDDAIINAGEAAELLYVRGLAFCAGSIEQDGYITDAQLKRFVGAGMDDAVNRAETLVREGLWERIDGGYEVRAWLKWNRSSDDLGRERKKDRDRKAARAAEVRAALIPEIPSEEPPDSIARSDDHSGRIPGGIQTEGDPESSDASGGTPDGFRPRAPAHEAGAPAGASGAALHSTALQNPPTPAASGEGDEDLFGHHDEPDDGPPPCPKHAASLGRRHGNCRACGTSARAAERLEDEAEFNKFWEVYPNKVGIGAARTAWVRARKKVDATTLINAAEAFRDDPRRKPDFTAHPATWLNQERWADQAERRSSRNVGGWLDN